MTYELSKQLKNAGFLQEGKGASVAHAPDDLSSLSDFVYEPTLEELIEACGERLIAIQRTDTGWEAVEEWEEYYPPEVKKGTEGSTPSEAVAKLWLALNKKV